MRVLFLTPGWPYPPHQGTALRNWQLLQAAARHQEVFLLSLAAPPPTAEAEQAVEAVTAGAAWVPAPQRRLWQRLTTVFSTPLPDMAQRLWSSELAALAADVISTANIRIVQAEGLEMAGMALSAASQVARQTGRRVPVLFDDHNAEWWLQRSACLVDLPQPARWPHAAYSLVQWQRLRRYEAALVRAASLTVAVSPEDATALSRLAGRPVRVLPHGLDVAAWRQRDGSQVVEPHSLLFTGKLDYRPNVDALQWFCADILPRVRTRYPDTHLSIVGRDPAPAVRALAGPAVTVVGAVADVQPYFARAAVYVIPMRMGSGARIKLLEAWAAGVPVVTTPAGGAGLSGQDGIHALLGGDAAQFACQIGRLFDHPTEGQRLAAAGRALVAQRYDSPAIWPQLAACYEAISGKEPDIDSRSLMTDD